MLAAGSRLRHCLGHGIGRQSLLAGSTTTAGGGALLVFAFFMISDPKTTPNSRAGRMLFALLVALGAAFVQFRLFRTNGLLWSMAVCSLAVPLIDLLLPGERYQWQKRALVPSLQTQSKRMKGKVYEPIPV